MPSQDKFENFTASLTSPFEDGFDINPDDNTDLPQVTRGYTVETAGDLRVTLAGGGTVTLPARQPGVDYAGRIRRVHNTGTSATGIVGLC